jgi:hypothetical protein
MTDNPYITLALNDRASVERAIDELIALLDHLDPAPDIEDNGDAEEEPDAEIEHDNEMDYRSPRFAPQNFIPMGGKL